MTRLIYDKCSKTFGFQDKFLWFWLDRTAQSDFYIHESCFEFIELYKRTKMKYKINIVVITLFLILTILCYGNGTLFYGNLILAFIAACTMEIKMHIDGVKNDS